MGDSFSMRNPTCILLFGTWAMFTIVFQWVAQGQEPEATSGGVTFRGLNKLTTEQAQGIIKHQIDYLAENGVSPARADDAAYFLGIGMRRMGFEEADVDWEIQGDSVVLVVSESIQKELGHVDVQGNEEIETDVLEALITQETRSRTKGILKSEQLPFVQQEIDKGATAIRALYANLGYYDATASVETIENADAALMDVRLSVQEGPLYRIDSVSIECLTDEMKPEREAIAVEFEGAPYTPASANVLQGRVLELYRNAGFSAAKIAYLEPTLGEKNAQIDVPVSLRVEVDAGIRRVLGEVTVSGNEKVDNDFFVRRFEPLQGKAYDEGRANRIVRRMLRSGAFSKVELQETPVADSDRLDLEIVVEETPAREVGAYAGVGSWEGFIVGATFQHHNLLGKVRRLDSLVEYTSRGISGEINVFEPWVLGEKTMLSGGVYAKRRDNDGYTKFQVGGQIELRYDLSEHARLGLFSRVAFTEILEHHVVDEELGDRSYLDHSVGLTFSYDKRDSQTVPTSGYIFSSSAEVAHGAIGSEVDFVRGSGRFSYYKTVGPVRLQAGARAGIIVPMGDTEQLPIDLRAFNGGSTTVRSFPQRELGPQDRRGNPIGGEFYTIFNAEASVPVWKELRFAGFLDSGNLLREYEDISLDDMHHAAGVGLRYDLPIGPIRLDYGWNLNRQTDEPEGAFHFGIGVSF